MDTKTVLLVGTLAMLILVVAIIVFVLVYQRKMFSKNVKLREAQLAIGSAERDMIYTVLEAQEEERKRIGRELHDNVNSILSTLKMYADAAQHPTTKNKEKLLPEISRIVALANEETRQLAHSLYNRSFDHYGFVTALNNLVTTVNSIGKLSLTITGLEEEMVASGFELDLYRVLQELINNSLRHSGGTLASVSFKRTDRVLEVIYYDNGKGIDLASNTNGMGLNSITERLAKHSAKSTLSNHKDGGLQYLMEFEYDKSDKSSTRR